MLGASIFHARCREHGAAERQAKRRAFPTTARASQTLAMRGVELTPVKSALKASSTRISHDDDDEVGDSCGDSCGESSEGSNRPLKSKRTRRLSWSTDLEVVHNVYDTHYRRTCVRRHRRWIFAGSGCTCIVLLVLAVRSAFV